MKKDLLQCWFKNINYEVGEVSQYLKSEYYSCRGPEFGSQYPCYASHNLTTVHYSFRDPTPSYGL